MVGPQSVELAEPVAIADPSSEPSQADTDVGSGFAGRPQVVLFDFDYTLADSSRGVIDCIDFALRELGLSPVSKGMACETIGLSLSDTLLRLAGPQHADKSAEFARLFVQRSDQVMTDKTVLLRPAPGAVRWLRAQGIALGIVSTKFRRRIEAFLRRESLLDLFDVIVGGEDVPRHKPDPTSLLLALEKLPSAPRNALYVGDSVTDAEAARRASVPFVAVLSGVTKREDFRGYAVCSVIEDVSGLPDLVSQMSKRGWEAS